MGSSPAGGTISVDNPVHIPDLASAVRSGPPVRRIRQPVEAVVPRRAPDTARAERPATPDRHRAIRLIGTSRPKCSELPCTAPRQSLLFGKVLRQRIRTAHFARSSSAASSAMFSMYARYACKRLCRRLSAPSRHTRDTIRRSRPPAPDSREWTPATTPNFSITPASSRHRVRAAYPDMTTLLAFHNRLRQVFVRRSR